MGQENFATLIRGFEERVFRNKGLLCTQYAVYDTIFNEYNQEHHLSLPIKHLGWVHNLILLQQVKDIRARYWYMVQSITSHWSKRYLQEAIKLDDYGKHGALANNFSETLPIPEANDVKSMLKDPYIFDMLTFTKEYNERDVEIGLVKHVENSLWKWEPALLSWGGSIT